MTETPVLTVSVGSGDVHCCANSRSTTLDGSDTGSCFPLNSPLTLSRHTPVRHRSARWAVGRVRVWLRRDLMRWGCGGYPPAPHRGRVQPEIVVIGSFPAGEIKASQPPQTANATCRVDMDSGSGWLRPCPVQGSRYSSVER